MRQRAFMALAVSGFVAALLTVQAAGQQTPRGGGAPGARQGGGGRGAAQLPEGPGRDQVQANCTACHGANLVAGAAGYTRQGWHDLISTMVKLPDDQMNVITQYLATNFPPRPGREPKLIPGDVQISFKEWVVPTLGQRSRDPIQLPNGLIYWTGQYASLVGELDPKTGRMREFKLAADVRPHSIVPDAAGQIWYMGNGNGTVGKIDPKTGETTQVVRMNVPNATDPHTGAFAPDGTLWFTLQGSNMVGRLVPSTGDLKLITLPTAGARPYGIKIDSKGAPWVAYNGSHKIATLDPVTMAVKEFPLPTPETRIRRLALLSDGTVFLVDNGRGSLWRLDPRTGATKEYPSPSGPRSHPYAIEVIDDIVWYNESNQRPDALVRFDPKTEKFQSWAIPSGYGIIRNMAVSPDGNLLIHQTMSNRIGVVTIPKVRR